MMGITSSGLKADGSLLEPFFDGAIRPRPSTGRGRTNYRVGDHRIDFLGRLQQSVSAASPVKVHRVYR
jgi:hypothetical protein